MTDVVGGRRRAQKICLVFPVRRLSFVPLAILRTLCHASPLRKVIDCMRTIIHVIIKRNVELLHKCRSLYGEHFTMAEGLSTPEAIKTLSVYLTTQPAKYLVSAK